MQAKRMSSGLGRRRTARKKTSRRTGKPGARTIKRTIAPAQKRRIFFDGLKEAVKADIAKLIKLKKGPESAKTNLKIHSIVGKAIEKHFGLARYVKLSADVKAGKAKIDKKSLQWLDINQEKIANQIEHYADFLGKAWVKIPKEDPNYRLESATAEHLLHVYSGECKRIRDAISLLFRFAEK
ncbi:hypothetical protein KKG83_08150 [Candidatus Micrarchaeota archaeon]|nr:hypothetical protein [Candidatus Micrarchaeota archaeon]